jgi:hypothetical protein
VLQVPKAQVVKLTRPQLFNTGVAKSLVEPDTVLAPPKPPKAPRRANGAGPAPAPPKKSYDEESAEKRTFLLKQIRARVARKAMSYTLGMVIAPLSADQLERVNGAIDEFFKCLESAPQVAMRLTADQAFAWIWHEVALLGHDRVVYAEAVRSYQRDTDDLIALLSADDERFCTTLKAIDEGAYEDREQLRSIVMHGRGPIALVGDKWAPVSANLARHPHCAMHCCVSPPALSLCAVLADICAGATSADDAPRWRQRVVPGEGVGLRRRERQVEHGTRRLEHCAQRAWHAAQ